MKYIHTFWSKPLLQHKFEKYNIALTYTLTNYTYSVACIHKLGEQIELYTDEYGAELLSFINYDKVHVISDIADENVHFAAQIKFLALKECNLGDVLIDGDLFIWRNEANELINSYKNYDLVYSFYEPPEYTMRFIEQRDKFQNALNEITKNNIHFEEPFHWPVSFEEHGWINASLMCFNNQELKDKYIEQYVKHKELLKNVNFKNFWPDLIIEQRFLTILSEKYATKAVIEDFYSNPKANDIALKLGFTHLGNLKKMYNNYSIVRLKNEDYDLYLKMYEQLKKYLKKTTYRRIYSKNHTN